ncbi:hypothetical protein BC830DRAFT_523805 [Chytriomyces sp. MP71]|nr:hypothetical protein BC830DRAFT_523805 [Chytriomyces sp. MP71]
MSTTSDECCSHGHSHGHSHQGANRDGTMDSIQTEGTESAMTREEDDVRRPKKAILSNDDLKRWLESDTRRAFVAFVVRLNEAAKNTKLSDSVHLSQASSNLLDVLATLEQFAKDIKPIHNDKSRFGNVAFQDWYDKMEQTVPDMVLKLAPQDPAGSYEASIYLINSWGNRKRIDYGTGHEAHFIAFLYCLEQMGVFTEEDLPALALRVFWRYIGVMRTLQFSYWLEPAGSHGVWGLDDYHFLPFLFGSAQFYDHKYLRPKCIHDPEILTEFSKDYMYLSCISFINSVKSASLRWHSPMLDDISGVKTWRKVNEGMMKMYLAEVLAKLPIMQHFLFASFLPFAPSGSMVSDEDALGCVHALGQERPACCFIRVPSAIAAAAATGDVGADARLQFGPAGFSRGGEMGAVGTVRPRPLPFD